ncbi:MAG: PAS domain S-box protein [Pyrinomonadaceae bacterium]
MKALPATSPSANRRKNALRESEERFRRAIAIETVGVIFLKTNGQITDANDAFLRMSGYDREDCQRGLLRWDKMTPPEFMPQMLKALDEFLTFGRIVPYEKQCIRKDGSRWWTLIAATRINAEEGVEFIIDITERKQTEERLRESEERLRLATRAALMYSWEIDLTTQEVKYSDKCRCAA